MKGMWYDNLNTFPIFTFFIKKGNLGLKSYIKYADINNEIMDDALLTRFGSRIRR